MEYLRRRGVDDATARKFMLGFAPQGGSGLVTLVKKESLALADAIKLGLVAQRNPQQYYEKFFARVMFPIANAAGKIVGFGGRVMDQGMPKYLNSSETPLFHKGSTVYGLHQAKESIRQADRVVVVEGYLDVIALAQHGVGYAVATLGTALTVEHVRALSRYTKNIIALFDGDDAGLKAAARSFEIFVEAGMLGRAAFLPKDDDPDTFVRKQGKDAVEKLLDQAVPLADYYFSWLQQRYGSTIEGKSQTASEIGRLLAKVTNPFEVDLLIRRAADLGVREELLRRPVANPASPRPFASSHPVAARRRRKIIATISPSVRWSGYCCGCRRCSINWRGMRACANVLATNGVQWLTRSSWNGKKQGTSTSAPSAKRCRSLWSANLPPWCWKRRTGLTPSAPRWPAIV